MSGRREIKEVICLAVPPGVACSTPEDVAAMRPWLHGVAERQVLQQYLGRRVRPDVRIDDIDWLVSSDVQEVADFEISHDCDECRAGTAKTAEYLREHPGQYVAVGNITYTETWPDAVVIL